MSRVAGRCGVALAVVLSLVACKGDARRTPLDSEGPRNGVTLVERASSAGDLEEIRDELDVLREAIEALGSQIDGAGSSDATRLDGRVAELEKQVGVRSINRQALTDLWGAVSKLTQRVEQLANEVRGASNTYGDNGLDGRVRSLEACVSKMRQSWGSSYAPYC